MYVIYLILMGRGRAVRSGVGHCEAGQGEVKWVPGGGLMSECQSCMLYFLF